MLEKLMPILTAICRNTSRRKFICLGKRSMSVWAKFVLISS